MVILGLHRMLIGITDFIVEKALCLSDISYSWSEGLLVTLVIELFLLPIIKWTQKHYPILLGKKKPIFQKTQETFGEK